MGNIEVLKSSLDYFGFFISSIIVTELHTPNVSEDGLIFLSMTSKFDLATSEEVPTEVDYYLICNNQTLIEMGYLRREMYDRFSSFPLPWEKALGLHGSESQELILSFNTAILIATASAEGFRENWRDLGGRIPRRVVNHYSLHNITARQGFIPLIWHFRKTSHRILRNFK